MADVEIIRKLGGSPTAIVHLAREPALRRLVVIKALRTELCDDPQAVRRFQREAQSAARISHANVCSIYRVGSTPKGVPFIVMEYVEGRTLDALARAEGPLTTQRIALLLSQVAAAIAAAHEKGVIHRDIRPANVLVERDSDRVVLTDFGIAAIHESGTELITRLTRQGEQLGDPDYSSPEQNSGKNVTEATDVYSLALIAIDLLNLGSDHSPKRSGPPAVDALVAPAMRDLLRRCLAEVPEHRPTAARVRDALAEMAADPGKVSAEAENEDNTLLDVGFGFLVELRRRKVYRMAAAYAAGALVMIEFLDVTGEALRIPEWLFRGVVAVLLGGFPVAVTLSWMFDFTKRGLERTQLEESGGRHRIVTLVLPLFGLGLSIGAALLVGWWILRD